MSDPARWQINQYAPPSLTPLFDPAQPQQQPQQQQSQQLRPLQPSPFRGYSTYTKPNIQLPEPDKADNRRTRISRAWYYYIICNCFFFSSDMYVRIKTYYLLK